MKRKFKLKISDSFSVDGEHYYGRIYRPGQKEYLHEVDQREEDFDVNTRWKGQRTIRFWTVKSLIAAAKEWFLTSPNINPGDFLVVDKEFENDL